MTNNQPPATNRQFREVVARLLPCAVQATARNRARHQPRRDHSVLADGCWLLAVGHFATFNFHSAGECDILTA
jgi:hypothetical protein